MTAALAIHAGPWSPNRQLVALLIADDHETLIFGDTSHARDLRRKLADGWGEPDEPGEVARLAALCTGTSYYTKRGPHRCDGSAREVAAALCALHGLDPTR